MGQKHMASVLSIHVVSKCRFGEHSANIKSPWVAVRRLGT